MGRSHKKIRDRMADDLEALADDVRIGSSIDLKVFHFLKSAARSMRNQTVGPVAQLAESSTQH